MSETGVAVPALDFECTDLVHRARGLDRRSIMRHVVGPALTGLLNPVYANRLQEFEVQQLPQIHSMGSLEGFSRILSDIADARIENIPCSPAGRTNLEEIKKVTDSNKSLFFNQDPILLLREGSTTGLTVPLNLSFQIDVLENMVADYGASYLENDFDVEAEIMQVDPQRLVEIMERPMFNKIILKLCKGPNGFLGSANYYPTQGGVFFHFEDPEKEGVALVNARAFQIVGGEVVGLSKLYELSAQDKRKRIRQRAHKYQKIIKDHTLSTSGCPVRQSYETLEGTGEAIEPLVITVKNFVVDGLRQAALKAA